MKPFNKRLTILSDEEISAFYDLPDFDESQREKYFTLTPEEKAVSLRSAGVDSQVYCMLQIGYFKAKQMFFEFTWEEIPKEDVDFILMAYFPQRIFKQKIITRYKHFSQRVQILKLFGYRVWSMEDVESFHQYLEPYLRRDVDPSSLVPELLGFFIKNKILRPGYSTLQKLMSEALNRERNRLQNLMDVNIDAETSISFRKLIERERILSELAALKQDAKDFRYKAMVKERLKLLLLKPLYKVAKDVIPQLGLSQKNLQHYADLAVYYTAHDLRERIQPNLTQLYLLCYVWKRFLQLNDNLIEAFCFHLNKCNEEAKKEANEHLFEYQKKQQSGLSHVSRLLRLFWDEDINDNSPFGEVKKKAFSIISEEELQEISRHLEDKGSTITSFKWQIIDDMNYRIKKHLRPLFLELDFESTLPNNPWIEAVNWLQKVFRQHQMIKQQPLEDCPKETIPKRLEPYLIDRETDPENPRLRADRYEFWIYRQLKKRLDSGELYLDDSLNHRCFEHELVSWDDKENILKSVGLSKLDLPISSQIKAISKELHKGIVFLNKSLSKGTHPLLRYDSKTKTTHWHKTSVGLPEELSNQEFYSKLPSKDLIDVIHFVNERCNLLSAFKPIQPRYSRKEADNNSIIAVIMSKSMNHTFGKMASIGDISYDALTYTSQQYVRLETLRAATDTVNNKTASLSIFPYYRINGEHYGSVDGQKFETERPTSKSRYSSKYFGTGKGVVAYNYLAGRIPLNSRVISAHQYEAHYTFDLIYNNTSDIMPTSITGDMHSINRANFSIFYFFWVSVRTEVY